MFPRILLCIVLFSCPFSFRHRSILCLISTHGLTSLLRQFRSWQGLRPFSPVLTSTWKKFERYVEIICEMCSRTWLVCNNGPANPTNLKVSMKTLQRDPVPKRFSNTVMNGISYPKLEPGREEKRIWEVFDDGIELQIGFWVSSFQVLRVLNTLHLVLSESVRRHCDVKINCQWLMYLRARNFQVCGSRVAVIPGVLNVEFFARMPSCRTRGRRQRFQAWVATICKLKTFSQE